MYNSKQAREKVFENISKSMTMNFISDQIDQRCYDGYLNATIEIDLSHAEVAYLESLGYAVSSIGSFVILGW